MTAELDGVRVFTAARRADRPYRAARTLRQSLLRRAPSATACSWRRRIRSIRFTSTRKAWPAADRQRKGKHHEVERKEVGARMSQIVVHGDTVYLAGIVAAAPTRARASPSRPRTSSRRSTSILPRPAPTRSKLLVGQYLDHRHGEFRRDERGVGRLGVARQHAGARDASRPSLPRPTTRSRSWWWRRSERLSQPGEVRSMAFDFASLVPAGSPAPAVKWKPPGKYNFTFGNNDPDGLAVEDLKAAVQAVLTREGRRLSDYRLLTGPQGYKPLREFLVKKLKRDAGIECTADDIVLDVGLAAGARSRQRRAARARRHRHLRARIATRARSTATRAAASTSSAFRSTRAACAWTRWRRRSPN